MSDDVLQRMRRKRRQLNVNTDNTTNENSATDDARSPREKENDAGAGDNDAIASVITRKHRAKSQELLRDIQNDDPNDVIKEIHDAKDKITEKIKHVKTDDEAEEGDRKRRGGGGERSRLDLQLTETDSIGGSRLNPDGTMTESTRLRLQKYKSEKEPAEINALKEKADEAIREETERSYRLRGSLRRRDQHTRFDDDDGEEQEKGANELNESSEQHLTMRSRFKKAAETVAKEFHMPNKEEQYDFFCKQWEPQKEEKRPKMSKMLEKIRAREKEKADKSNESIKPVEEEAAAKEGEEEKKEDEQPANETTTLIQMFEDDDWKNTVYVKATYTPHEKQKQAEAPFYFVPNATQIPLSMKLKEDHPPRYLEKEGFYVGKKPYVKRTNRNLMEHRLINMPAQSGMKWFGLDGELIALPDPIKYVSTRPSFAVTLDPAVDTHYKRAVLTEIEGNRMSGALGSYRIDIDINKIEFSYHHLFSQEHVLAFKLMNMYQHFKMIEDQSLIKILTEKLKALKQAENYLEQDLPNETSRTIRGAAQPTPREMMDKKKLKAYKYEIQKTRQERNKEMKLHKQLVERIIQTWKEIKEARQQQQFRNTDIKLIIKKKDTNKRAEEDVLRDEIEDAYRETRSLKVEEYEKAMDEYNTRYNKWKYQKNKKKEAQKRQTARENETVEEKNKKLYEETERADLIALQEPELPKPEKPSAVDEVQLRAQIEAEYTSTFKQPGQPILSFEIARESNISPVEQCSALEKIRRDILSRTRVYVKILFNGKPVYKTAKLSLRSDFTVEFAQIFQIYMIYWPESIRLQIYEFVEQVGPLKRRVNETVIAEIILPVPDANCTCNNYDLEKYEFSSPNEFYMRKGNDVTSYYQSGILFAGAGWGVNNEQKVLIPPTLLNNNYLVRTLQNYDAVAALGVARMQDSKELANWIFKSNLDPNDPRNCDLIDLIQAVSGSSSYNVLDGFDMPDYFRLDQFMKEFNFAQDEETFFNSKRFQLIEFRSKEEPEFKNFKMIPSMDRFIARDAFDVYNKRKNNENQMTDAKEENEIEAARLTGRRMLQKIRENILKRYRYRQHQKTLADMIVEETIPNLTALGHLFWNLYVEPRRPLYPIRKERKKITGQSVIPEEVQIMINIASAYDLPIRKDKMTNDPIKVIKDAVTNKSVKVHEKIAGESLVNPYVEVTFQKTVYRTATADGPNSSWNQEIRLPFKAPNNDFTPSSLQSCSDIIYFNVYDEIEIDILEDDRDRDHVIHKQIQRNWLGSLEIPFSSLYFNSRIDGTFKLDSPPIMLGYTRDSRLSRVYNYGVLEDNLQNFEMPNTDASYISLFMTIEPPLLVPEPLIQTFDSVENSDLLNKAVIWTENHYNKHPNREFRATVMDINGKSVFVTRFFRPIKPPEELSENGDASFLTAQNVARFVSLIPIVSDTLIFPGLCDIWSTCDQFMQVLGGDDEEHAILLTNYFLGLGKRAWLLIGKSATQGVSAYCMSIENTDYTIWYSGKPYKINESHNPVRVVSALVNADNIWANIQDFDEPYRIKFDVNDAKCWQPFFSKATLPNELRSIQPESLTYYPTDLKYVKELETRIETKLREKIEEWRPRHITKLNRYGCTALRQILTRIEKTRDEVISTEPEELAQILNSYRMSGFPINLAYTNINAIFEAVYATQVHAIPSSDVEFALAAHIHPYPNTVLSVWVYVASLVRKK